MMPSGLPTPMGGGAQSVPASLLRSNSGMLGAQNGQLPSQGAFSSLVSSRAQFNNMNMLGNVGNVPSLLNQSLVNGLSVPGANFHGGVDTGAQSVALSGVNNGMGFHTSSSYVPSNLANPGSGQLQGQQLPTSSGNQVMLEQQQNEQLETQNFQPGQQSMRQFSATNNSQQQQQQQQLQPIRGGLSGVEQVKLESQMSNDQQGQQQLQSLRSLASVKMEPQQIQTMRSLGPVKMERQHSNQSFLQQQQQQQQHQLLLSRQSSQAAAAQINLLHRQRLLQMQQQHQQQLPLTGLSQQHSPLQQQLQQQNLQMRSPMKPVYKPGTCARRLTNYMYQQQHRPEENNIEFWRKFVAEYFAPNAKKKWCVSMYGSGRQTNGVFPQDVWHCEICNRKPGRGFEATMEVLPRLFKIKYESGTLEELLYVDMPREYQNSSGQIVLDYAKAIQESVFEQLRVVREGQLRIVFSPDLKIFSWEFCARRHEELIPRRLLIPQVSQLGAATQKYQAATQNASSSLATLDLKNNCNIRVTLGHCSHSSISISCQSPTLTRRRFDTRLQSSWTAEFVSSARQLAKALEVPLVNDLGYTKRYVRCLQISEVVNCMKDLIDYSRDTGTGPMESLAKFTRTTSASAGFNGQTQQSEQQLQHQQQQRQQLQNLHQQNTTAQHGNNDQNSAMLTASNGIANAGTSVNAASTATASSIIVERLLHQNSMNPVQQTTINNASSPYGGSSMQALSPGSSITIPQAQSVPSPFHSPTPSSSNNPPQPSHSGVTAGNKMNSTNSPANISMQQPSVSVDADPRDSQSSVQKVIQELMSNQLSGSGALVGPGSLGNTVNINGILPSSSDGGLNDGNCLVGNGAVNSNSGMAAAGFSAMGGRLGQSAMINGIRAAMGNNSVVNGRVGVMSMTRDQSVNQQDLSNQLLDVLGTGNGFNNLQFDWKPSP